MKAVMHTIQRSSLCPLEVGTAVRAGEYTLHPGDSRPGDANDTISASFAIRGNKELPQ